MNFNNFTKETIIRTAALALALVNQVLSVFGLSPIPVEEETLEQLISAGITVVTAVVGWWWNNSFSRSAVVGDAAKDAVRGGGTVRIDYSDGLTDVAVGGTDE